MSRESLYPIDEEAQKPLFELGRIVGTQGALAALIRAQQTPKAFLACHLTGDWGDVPDEDKKENDLSVAQGLRILSAYTLETGSKFG